MTIEEINTKVDALTHTTPTTGYLAANRLIDLNNAQDEVHMEILKAVDGKDFDDLNYTDNFPIRPTSLKKNQRDYTLPTNAIKIKRVTISYDGVNWYKATPFDINESGTVLKDSLFSVKSPRYDLLDNSIKIYPAPSEDVTNGLKLWVDRQMEKFTPAQVDEGTKEPGFDRAYHKIIAYKMALEYSYENLPEKVNILEGKIDKMMEKMREDYSDKQIDDNSIVRAESVNYN